MTDNANTKPVLQNVLMTSLPGAAVSAQHFNGAALSTPAAVGALSATKTPANHPIPTILQQIAMYRRLQKARKEQNS